MKMSATTRRDSRKSGESLSELVQLFLLYFVPKLVLLLIELNALLFLILKTSPLQPAEESRSRSVDEEDRVHIARFQLLWGVRGSAGDQGMFAIV